METPSFFGFESVQLLKQSATGNIYRAKNSVLGNRVLIKTMPEQAQKNERVRARFKREIALNAQISHPLIDSAFHAGRENGTYYLVFHDHDSKSLAEVVKKNGPLPIDKAIDCICQAGTALGHLHGLGIYHRNVKPENLMIDSSGTVRLTNLTLALIDEDADIDSKKDEALTRHQDVIGTAEYMAPEQAFDSHSADHRSDIYSLGCTLFYILVGKKPYGGKSRYEKIAAHTQEAVPSLASYRKDITEQLDKTFQQMLAKMPVDRPQSVSDVTGSLRRFMYGSDGQIRSRKSSFRWEVVMIGLVIGVLVTLMASMIISFLMG